MSEKVCFMFGHATAAPQAYTAIWDAAAWQYTQQGIQTFVVGSRGSFDRMAARAIRALKKQHPKLKLLLLLAYYPTEKKLPEGFDGSVYPPLEGIPHRVAIVKANQYMIENADAILCYVSHVGNSRNLLDYAHKKRQIPIINVADDGEIKRKSPK